jgi:hypothetical protein
MVEFDRLLQELGSVDEVLGNADALGKALREGSNAGREKEVGGTVIIVDCPGNVFRNAAPVTKTMAVVHKTLRIVLIRREFVIVGGGNKVAGNTITTSKTVTIGDLGFGIAGVCFLPNAIHVHQSGRELL